MSSMNLQLKRFNPKTMPDDAVCVFVGKRRTGKSQLLKDMMYHKRHIPAGVVLSGTEEGNSFFGAFVPDLFVYGDYDKEALERVVGRQKQMLAAKKCQPAFVVLDDCMYNPSFLKDKIIRQCFMNGRHWKLWFALTLQYSMDLPPSLRANCDYVFVLRENVLANRERLWKNFFGIVPTFDMFCKILDATTENYECLVLDNTSKSNKLTDCIFYYKADLRKNFRVGSPKFWSIHKKMYNPSHAVQEDPRKADKKTALKITKKK